MSYSVAPDLSTLDFYMSTLDFTVLVLGCHKGPFIIMNIYQLVQSVLEEEGSRPTY